MNNILLKGTILSLMLGLFVFGDSHVKASGIEIIAELKGNTSRIQSSGYFYIMDKDSCYASSSNKLNNDSVFIDPQYKESDHKISFKLPVERFLLSPKQPYAFTVKYMPEMLGKVERETWYTCQFSCLPPCEGETKLMAALLSVHEKHGSEGSRGYFSDLIYKASDIEIIADLNWRTSPIQSSGHFEIKDKDSFYTNFFNCKNDSKFKNPKYNQSKHSVSFTLPIELFPMSFKQPYAFTVRFMPEMVGKVERETIYTCSFTCPSPRVDQTRLIATLSSIHMKHGVEGSKGYENTFLLRRN